MNKSVQIMENQQVESADEVVITITNSIPQPDIIKTETITVGQIKQRMSSIDEDLANLQSEKENLQSLLDSATPELSKISIKVNE